MFFEGKVTTDPLVIKKWAQDRKGWPAKARNPEDPRGTTVIEIAFSDGSDKRTFTAISWEEFFERFESDQLVFLYQDQSNNGSLSRSYSFL